MLFCHAWEEGRHFLGSVEELCRWLRDACVRELSGKTGDGRRGACNLRRKEKKKRSEKGGSLSVSINNCGTRTRTWPKKSWVNHLSREEELTGTNSQEDGGLGTGGQEVRNLKFKGSKKMLFLEQTEKTGVKYARPKERRQTRSGGKGGEAKECLGLAAWGRNGTGKPLAHKGKDRSKTKKGRRGELSMNSPCGRRTNWAHLTEKRVRINNTGEILGRGAAVSGK